MSLKFCHKLFYFYCNTFIQMLLTYNHKNTSYYVWGKAEKGSVLLFNCDHSDLITTNNMNNLNYINFLIKLPKNFQLVELMAK